MEKLKKILYKRNWNHKSLPLDVFENRLIDMMNLQGSTLRLDILDSSKNEGRKQYIIMLVVCYETYAREVFKILIDEEIINPSDLMTLKKIKNVQFAIDEIEVIKKENIKFSELVCEYINFQNLHELREAFSLIDLDKKLQEAVKNKDEVMPNPKKLDYSSGAEFANLFFKEFVKHKKLFNNIGSLYTQIEFLLRLRHNIIHNNIDIAIDQEDILIMTSAVYEFVILLDKLIQDMVHGRKEKVPSRLIKGHSAETKGQI
jgi:hypothetical protein